MKGFIEKNKISIILALLIIVLIVSVGTMVYLNKKKIDNQVIIWDGPGGQYKIDIKNNEAIKTYITYVVVQGKTYGYPLRYSPYDIKNITIDNIVLKALLTKQTIFVTRDPGLGNKTEQNSSLAAMEFGEILGNGQFGLYKRNVHAAFTSPTNDTIKLGIPIATCSNVTNSTAIVYMKLGNKDSIHIENNCIILEALNGESIIKVGEKLAYTLLGVF